MCNPQEINFGNKKNKFLELVWVVVLIGGLFMVYGGILDIMVYFQKTLPFAPPPWYSVDAKISLVFGVFVLILALYLILISFKVKTSIKERRINRLELLIKSISIVCLVGMIADFIAGYYARGFLLILLALIYLNYNIKKKNKIQFLFISLIIVIIIIVGFILTGGK